MAISPEENPEEKLTRSIVATCILMGGLGLFAAARAEPGPVKPMKIWNLTAGTIVDLRLAPVDAATYGRNLVLDDKDREIDGDERLVLHDVAPGIYDVKVAFKNKRNCRVPQLKLEEGEIASIEEADLRSCSR